MDQKVFYNKFYKKREKKYFQPPWWSKLLKSVFPDHYGYRIDVVSQLIPKCGRLLDIGCGDGDLIDRIARRVTEIYGIDVSSERLDEAKKRLKGAKNIYLIEHDVTKGLNFSDNFFEYITLVAVLEHLLYPDCFLEEVNRTLKKNGVLIIEVPNLCYIKDVISLIFGKLPWAAQSPGHLHLFTLESLKRLLMDKGFKIIKVTGSGNFYKIRSLWPSKFLSSIIIVAQK